MIPNSGLTIPILEIPVIDEQHRKLLDEFDRLNYWISKGHDFAAAIDALNKLNHYVTEHLDHEEAMLEQQGYPKLEHHRRLHSYFRKELANCSRQLIEGAGNSAELAIFLRQWIVEHIGKEDVEYANFLAVGESARSETAGSRTFCGSDSTTLDIDVAITAHKAWRQRLEWAIDGTVQDIPPPERIQDDTACALGAWLCSEGPLKHPNRSFDELITVHRQFHAHAAQIVRLSSNKQNDEAHQLLEGGYSTTSERVIALLTAMRNDEETRS